MNRKQRRAGQSKGAQPPATPNNDPLMGIFNEALQHHSAGRPAEAEKIYTHILTLNPRHAHSLHMLGLIAFDARQYDVAENFVRKALAERKDIPMFHSNLGNILKSQGKPEEAIINYERALALKPDFADCLGNMGTTLLLLGRKNEALAAYKRAIAANPKHFNSMNNIGVILQEQKKYEEAIKYYQQAIAIKPDFSSAHRSIGLTLRLLNRHEEAKASFESALHHQPDYADAVSDLANLLRDLHRYDEATKLYERAISLRPDGHAHANIGSILKDKGRVEESVLQYERARALLPNSFEIFNNLGTIYDELGKYNEAVSNYKKSLTLQPGKREIISNLATALKNLGQLDEAIVLLKGILNNSPEHSLIYSNLLLTMIYAQSVSPEELAATAREFGANIADPMLRQRPFANDKNPERKLRIGYVSPDFFQHAVNYFFEHLLTLHDRDQFEVFGYSNTLREDAVTERLKQKFDHWRDIRHMDNDAIADMIETDKIDILIDLAGHTARNSLLVFARKPAPVQVNWLGYPATTGMKAMDYRITDVYGEPPGMTEHLNVEELCRLPEIFCCYKAHENSPAVIDHPPFEDNGFITFGCFNNFTKVTDPVLSAWSKIMEQAPASRLLIEIAGIDDAEFRTEVESRLARFNFNRERVILEPRKRSNQFVLYNKIDIALDPFPCVGGTTSMDTLWMGVPFVTLAGNHFVSRMGVTILTNAGLPELIANNVDEYIKISSDLANDRPRLKDIRHNLRDKVAASPVMNQQSFARNMEEAYREMWRKWCAGS